MSVEEEIKSMVRRFGADEVGIVSVGTVEKKAPKGFKPSRYLPGAKSIVSFLCRIHPATFKVRENIWQREEASIVIRRVNSISYRASRKIQREYGYHAAAVPGNASDILRIPWMSQKHLAREAGLGHFALPDTIINPKYGSRFYLGSFITTLPLEPDGVMDKNPCPHPKCVALWEKERTTYCMNACNSCFTGQLEKGRIKMRWFQWERCEPRARSGGDSRAAKCFEALFNAATREERLEILASDGMRRIWKGHATETELFASCFECMRVCPVGKESVELE